MKRALVLSSMLLAACSNDQGPVGEATATITQVPAGVACIQIQVVGTRTVIKNVDVMTGQSTVVSLPNLPAGPDTFSAVAFAVPCSVSNGAVANWASDPVVATVAAGGVTPVTLAMHAVGGANVGIDFPGDGGVMPFDGGPSDLSAPPADLSAPPADLSFAPTDMTCVPLSAGQACMTTGTVCGTVPDGCGGLVNCGVCSGATHCCSTSCVPMGMLCI